MDPNLAELGAMLNRQLPVLASFVVLRQVFVACCEAALNAALPSRARALADTAVDTLRKARVVAFVSGLVQLAFLVVQDDAPALCAAYHSSKPQGFSALISLGVLLLTNDVLGSAIALGALRAVATGSSSSLVLTTSAAVMSIGDERSVLVFYHVVCMTSLYHAVMCHDNKTPTRTHGSVIALIAIAIDTSVTLVQVLYARCRHVATCAVKQSVRVCRRARGKLE
jgi:hypothetical protein